MTGAAVFQADRNAHSTLLVSGSYLTLPPCVYFYPDFTVSSWVFAHTNANGFILLDIGNGQYIDNIVFEVKANRKPFLNVYDGSPIATPASVLGVRFVRTGEWVHLAVTYDGTNGKMYINGAEDKSTAITRVHTGVVRRACFIGTDQTKSVVSDVSLSDLRIYERALSATEIGALQLV